MNATILCYTHKRDFAQIANSTLQDWRLSLKARGLIALIISLPKDWIITVEWLSRQGKDHKDSVRTALADLEKFGYARYVRAQHGGQWQVREGVDIEWKSPDAEIPQAGKPQATIPQAGNPELQIRDSDKNDLQKDDADVSGFDFDFTPASKTDTEIPPSLQGEAFLIAWDLWRKHRSESRKKLTPTSTRLQLSKLAEMGIARAIAAIRHSIEKGYTGIYESGNQRQSRIPESVRAVQEGRCGGGPKSVPTIRIGDQ